MNLTPEARYKISLGAKHANEIIKIKNAKKLQIKKAAYLLSPSYCLNCNKQLEYDHRTNKFCDHTCAAKFNNVKRGLKGHPAPLHNCIFCNHENWEGKKFCSLKCQQAYKWEQTKKKIEETGIASHSTGRRYLLTHYGAKCNICSLSEWLGKPVLLILDHINGHHSDWRITNLRLICPNCDAQTPTYKGRNKGNGRDYRSKYYKPSSRKKLSC